MDFVGHSTRKATPETTPGTTPDTTTATTLKIMINNTEYDTRHSSRGVYSNDTKYTDTI